MEGLQYRPKPNTTTRDADMDELLSNGFWKSSRAKAQVSESNRSPYPSSPVIHDNHKVTRPKISRTSSLSNYKKPICEDELQSLIKEVDSAVTSSVSLLNDEPPARGCIEQHPILLEADASASDTLKYENQSREDEAWEQAKNGPKQDKNEEKRFVLIPTETTYSPFIEPVPEKGLKHPEVGVKSSAGERRSRHEDKRSEKSPRRTSRDRKEIQEANHKRDAKHNKDSENAKSKTLDTKLPSLSKHRSRQELPTLKTQIHQESPPFNRSVSDFAFSSQSPERRRREASRQQNGEYLLSPESPLSGRSPSKGYFDSVPRRFPSTQGQTTPRQTLPEERNIDVHLLTPKSATFPQDKRTPSTEDIHLGPAERSTSNSSTAPVYYVSSEDESLTDGDDDDLIIPPRDDREYHHGHHRHHRHHSHNSKHLGANIDKDDRHRRSASRTNLSSLEVNPASRFVSPLPSPNVSPTQTSVGFAGHDTLPAARDGKKEGSRSSSFDLVKMLAAAYTTSLGTETKVSSQDRPKSRRTSPSSESIKSPRSSGHSLSIPIPPRGDIRSSTDSLLSPILNESNRKTQIPRSPTSLRTPQPIDGGKPFWQPSSFYPDENSFQNSVGAYRRYSEDINRGHTQRIPDCPRINPVAGKVDWLTLPGCPSFDICSTCFKATMGKTEFATHFAPSPRRRTDEKISCSFGSCPWYRIAWILTLKEGRKDLRMFHSISKIDSTEPPCLGPHRATRTWYSVVDPATHKPVERFNVCPSCKLSIEAVLPPLKNILVQKALYDKNSGSLVQKTRTCAMHFDSPRFVKYFDTLETTADTALANFNHPNTADFVALAKRYAAIDECPGTEQLYCKKWHYISQLPEFTVCAECYEDVVRPGRKEGLPIPMMFERQARKVVEGDWRRCYLAGEKNKEWFRGTVEKTRDFSKFARAARERTRLDGL